MKEHLATLKLKNGRSIDLYRDHRKDVVLVDDGKDIRLPKASGKLTLDIINLLDLEEVVDEND